MWPMRRLIPASLFGRLTLILVAGLLAAQFISLWLHMEERQMLLAQGYSQIAGVPTRFWMHLALTLGAVIAVALIGVRLVTRPIQRLADAADAFGRDIDSPPMEELGPTETRRAAEAFNRMQTRLKRLIAERSRALAAVSHDLRTPLTRMRLRAELVDDEALRAQINGDIDDMQAMVEATLDYLRGLRDTEAIQRIDIEALLQSLVSDQQAMGRTVHLVDGRPAEFSARPCALRRALTNLTENAVQFGGSASLRCDASSDRLRLIVEDDGPGIPEESLASVVEPYVRLDASRSRATGGVGLGLAIARDVARLHGGELLLANRSEGGLRATLDLPRV
jgi:signal transduction histidine kinase